MVGEGEKRRKEKVSNEGPWDKKKGAGTKQTGQGRNPGRRRRGLWRQGGGVWARAGGLGQGRRGGRPALRTQEHVEDRPQAPLQRDQGPGNALCS